MGFLDNIFENKAAKKTQIISKESISRSVAGTTNSYTGMVSNANTWDLDRTINLAYERVIWVFRSVDAIASAQAGIPINLKEYNTEAGHKVEDENLNKLLNRKTNKYEDSWTFRYRLSSLLLLSPKGVFVELVKSASHDVVEMYILLPNVVEPVRDEFEYVKHYKVKRANGKFDILEPDRIVWLKMKGHPLDPYSQVTPILPSKLAIETDYLARLFNRNFLRNDGRPGMLIGVKGDLTSEDGDEIKGMFSGGYHNAGETRVIEADNISVIDLAAKPRDVQWDDAIKNSKEEILLAFGVPESVLGNASGRCIRATEDVFLASGEIKKAQELVGTEFELLQPEANGETKAVKATAEYALKEKIYEVTTFSGRKLQTNGIHKLYMAHSVNKGPFKRDIFTWGWTEVESIKKHFDENDAFGNDVYTEVAVPVSFDQKYSDLNDVKNPALTYEKAYEDGVQADHIPDYLFTADKLTQIGFISGLYSHKGLLSQHTSLDIYPSSLEFATKLQRLLVRIGVHSSIGVKKLKHVVSIGGKINIINFLSQIELTGDNLEYAEKVWERLTKETSRELNSFRSDSLPPGFIWDRVYSVKELGEDQTVAITIKGKNSNYAYLSMFLEHNTYNNADSEEENFWTKTMVPHCDSIARALEPLTNDDNDTKYLSYDYSTVDVLQRIKRRKDDEIKQDFTRGIITLNELLVAIGMETIDTPYANVYFHPSRLVGGNTADVEAVRNLPVIGANNIGQTVTNPFNINSSGGGDGQVGQTNDLVQGQLAANDSDVAAQTIRDQAARVLRSGKTTGVGDGYASPNAIVEVRERIDHLLNRSKTYKVSQWDDRSDIHQQLRYKLEGFIGGHLDSWSNRQLKIVSERIDHAKVRKGTRHWSGDELVTKDLSTDYIVESNVWVSELVYSLAEKLIEYINEETKGLINSLSDANYQIDIDEDEIKKVVIEGLTYLINSAQNQTNLVAKHINVLDTSGKSIEDIKETIVPSTFDRNNWSTSLSKVVVTHIIESVYDTIYSKVSDGTVYKVWYSGTKEHYRSGHGNLHGTKVKVNETFDINNEKLKYPGEKFDNEGTNCSCWIVYEIESSHE